MKKPQFITDTSGNRVSVIVSLQEYETMLAAIEELADIKVYDKVKSNKADYIDIDEAFMIIEQKRQKNALQSSTQ